MTLDIYGRSSSVYPNHEQVISLDYIIVAGNATTIHVNIEQVLGCTRMERYRILGITLVFNLRYSHADFTFIETYTLLSTELIEQLGSI